MIVGEWYNERAGTFPIIRGNIIKLDSEFNVVWENFIGEYYPIHLEDVHILENGEYLASGSINLLGFVGGIDKNESMKLSVHTIKDHKKSIFKKLNCSNVKELFAAADNCGLRR